MKIKSGILNVTGYAGAELARILHLHPQIELVQVTGRSLAGKMLSEVMPHLADIDLPISENLDASVDCVFSALPHAASAEALEPFARSGVPCVDISADFRIKDAEIYKEWYKIQHPCPDLLTSAVYGLPELVDKSGKRRSEVIRSARLVANPGCFPTGMVLGTAPALAAGIIEPNIINDSKTGVSGAGRTAKSEFGFSELNDNCFAYAIAGHRHQPEMEQELAAVASGAVQPKVMFVPTLVPMTRGIIGASYASLKHDISISAEEVLGIYRDYYAGQEFIKITNRPPASKHTYGSNIVRIYVAVKRDRGIMVVLTALDNLVKGAAGSAVQNMNLMLGLDEGLGLRAMPIYP